MRWLGTAFCAALLAFASAPAWADEASESFIKDRADRVVAILNTPAPAEEKASELGKIFDDSVGVESIALYTLGKYRAGAPQDELTRYVSAFRAYLFQDYVAPASKLSGVSISVDGSTDLEGTRGSVVRIRAKTSLPEPTELDFHVVGDSSIVDVEIAGISAAALLRAQVIAVLGLSGGNISAAIDLLNRLTPKT